MASRRLTLSGITADALSDEDIRRVEVPSIVNLWASTATAGDTLGLRLDKTIIMDDGGMNVESSAGVIDTDRDQLVFGTVVGVGQLRAPFPTVTATSQFLISVEPIL